MATLFILQIFKYRGLPKSIVSDRDPRMMSLFWQGLFENLGTRLDFSSAYHPQMDGQSEIVNSIVLDLLKTYVNVVDHCNQWEKYLPLVEYAYNNTVLTSLASKHTSFLSKRLLNLIIWLPSLSCKYSSIMACQSQ